MLYILNQETSFDILIGQSFELIVLYFTAEWCGPCKLIWPEVQKISEKNPNSILFIKIDVDEFEDLSSSCDVSCMPTFQFYRRNQKDKIDILEVSSKEELINKCRSHIQNYN